MSVAVSMQNTEIKVKTSSIMFDHKNMHTERYRMHGDIHFAMHRITILTNAIFQPNFATPLYSPPPPS